MAWRKKTPTKAAVNTQSQTSSRVENKVRKGITAFFGQQVSAPIVAKSMTSVIVQKSHAGMHIPMQYRAKVNTDSTAVAFNIFWPTTVPICDTGNNSHS